MFKINKKGIEGEGMKFSLNKITFLIIFLIVLALMIILVLPRVSHKSINETEYNFAKAMLEALK